MTITNGYITLAQFKQRFNVTTTDANRDTDLELVIQATSRAIEYETGTVFYAGTPATQRYFPVEFACKVFVDDCTTITAVAVDYDWDGTAETTLTASTDYLSFPVNSGPALAGIIQWIELTPWSSYGSFPIGNPRGLAVTATYGNNTAAALDLVREACLLQSNRIWARRNAPFGVAGANEFGVPIVIVKLDPDVVQLLAPVSRRRNW